MFTHSPKNFSILVYAVRWNKLQEDVSARKSLLDAWRQVLIRIKIYIMRKLVELTCHLAIAITFLSCDILLWCFWYFQVAEVLLCSSVPTDDVLTPNSKQQLLLDLLQTLLNKVRLLDTRVANDSRPKSPNAEGSGSDQKPRPKSPRASPDRNKPICYPTYRTSALHAGPYNDGWIIAILEVMFYLFCLSTIRITLHDIYI